MKILQELAVLKHNEKKSHAQLQKMQEQKLRAMLTYAYEHSCYYKTVFEAIPDILHRHSGVILQRLDQNIVAFVRLLGPDTMLVSLCQ